MGGYSIFNTTIPPFITLKTHLDFESLWFWGWHGAKAGFYRAWCIILDVG